MKRSNFQVLSEILRACKKPISEKNLKLELNLPPTVLQQCIIQLLLSNWLENLKVEGSKFRYFVTTEKGTVFLEKYLKLQQLLAPTIQQEQQEQKSIKQKTEPTLQLLKQTHV